MSAALESGPWTYEATYSLRRNYASATEGASNEHLADFTAIYQFGDDVTLLGETWQAAAGYSYGIDAEGETAHIAALRITTDYGGSFPVGR